MAQANVVYADVQFTKHKRRNPGETSSTSDNPYCEVRIKQPSDSTHIAPSTAGSKVTTERVALVILSALLTAAVVTLICVSWSCIQSRETLCHVTSMNRKCTGELNEPLHQASCPTGVNTTKRCTPCPEDWEEHSDRCYLFNEKATKWHLARNKCLHQGGGLVHIDSRDEQSFLTTRLSERSPEDKFWIGLKYSQAAGEWLWVDGSPLDERLSFWSKEIDGGEGPVRGEDCVRMELQQTRGVLANWFDKNCHYLQKSICEKPAARGHVFCV